MQEDMKIIKNEWQKKCTETEQQSELEIKNLKSRHKQNIENMQKEYEKMLEAKLYEFQNDKNN